MMLLGKAFYFLLGSTIKCTEQRNRAKCNMSRKKVKKRRNIEHRKSEHVGRNSEYVLPEGFPNCFGVWKCKIRGIVPVYESVEAIRLFTL